jgi:hypothetical protein
MESFFTITVIVGAFITWLALVQANAPSDSWPRSMQANIRWGLGLLLVGAFGLACTFLP